MAREDGHLQMLAMMTDDGEDGITDSVAVKIWLLIYIVVSSSCAQKHSSSIHVRQCVLVVTSVELACFELSLMLTALHGARTLIYKLW